MAIVYSGALTLGFVAGLRTLAAPAVLLLQRGGIAGYLLGIAAVFEMVVDAVPRVPARTGAPGLTFRIVSGMFVGWAFCSFHVVNPILGALLGGVGAVAGAFLGLRIRLAAIQRIGAFPAALLEDVVAVGLAVLVVTR
jgi:uncharacterized membrane protein